MELQRRAEALAAGGSQRRGQAYFNVLHDIDPSLAKSICGTGLDPFYNDKRLPAFLSHVATAWNVAGYNT